VRARRPSSTIPGWKSWSAKRKGQAKHSPWSWTDDTGRSMSKCARHLF